MGSEGKRNAVRTPALILDIDILDQNIATMVAMAKSMGVLFRPHAKAHKCVNIAQRLHRAGAVGACCATIGEAETLASGGITGLLITSPLITSDQIQRLRSLLAHGADVAVVADHPRNIDAYAQLAKSKGGQLEVLIDFDFGQGRTGCCSVEEAVALAALIARYPSLRLLGVQAYWGHLQQVVPMSERQRLVGEQQERLRGLIRALTSVGHVPEIVSGAGTGTHGIDGNSGLFTEIQPGSFLFMDSCYDVSLTSESGNPFTPSLFVAASVVSANHPGRVIVNAGLKAFATDSGKPRPWRGAPTDATYRFMGDEHGAVEFDGQGPGLADTIEFLTSHCDPTVNLHSAFHVVRGDEIIDIWPINARY
jgi:3-hydroxy-D-aspartate aldolase